MAPALWLMPQRSLPSRIPPLMGTFLQDALHPCQEGERQNSWSLALQHTPMASDPSTVTPTLPGPWCLKRGFWCNALGQGDRDVARADVTELAGTGQHTALQGTHQQRWPDWDSGQEKGWSSVPGSTQPGPTGCPPSVSPHTLALSLACQGHSLSWERRVS